MLHADTTLGAHVRFVLISDTHLHHRSLELPPGDVLVHAGDSTARGTARELDLVATFWRAQPHPHKIIIAGNHDFELEADPALGAKLFGDDYLCDAPAEIAGLRVWGSPWQPWFHDWAFNLPRGEAIRAKWDLIPEHIDVLVTHGPPMSILDRTVFGEHVGCDDLREAALRIAPRLHVFGHIHEAYGTVRAGATLYVNASTCDLSYRPNNRPIVVDVPRDRTLPAVLVTTEA